MDINRRMTWPKKYWRLFLATAIAILALFAVHSLGEARAQRKREAAYEVILRSYAQVLKPGMTRKEVEDYLRARNRLFRQMCCVNQNRFSQNVYDDLTNIGQEDAPWFCSEKNIYVAFQFAGRGSHATAPSAEASDTLTAVTIYPWLEGCL
jgi:hypothetical protein